MNIPEKISVKKKLLQKAAYTSTPISGTFELTPRCNMNCKMCYIHMHKTQMIPFGTERSADEWIEFGKECVDNGMLFLLLTGGEPFLRPDFKKIYSSLKRLGIYLSINTNGTLLTDDDIELLANEKPEIVNITLYGASSETYEKLCGYKEGYEKVIRNIDKLKEKNVPLQINVTLTKDNINDLEKIVEFGKSRDIPLKITSYIFNPVRMLDGSLKTNDVVFSPEEAGKARFLTMKHLLDTPSFNYLRSEIRNENFELDLHTDDCDDLQVSNMKCMAGRSAFWITWDGRMLPCGMMNHPFSKPFDTGFKKAWEYVNGEVEKIILPAKCNNCKAQKLCRPCGAIVQSENGNFSTKPEYLCGSTQKYIELFKSEKD